ncbi:MAG: sugar phosphate isomerase/epimerase family protein [Candidatus Bathyarchaeia archaeon]
MKVSCAWLYAITKYGYPPSFEKSLKAIKEMAGLGFKFIEVEIVSEKQLLEYKERYGEIRKVCKDLGVRIINLCAIFPDIVSLNNDLRSKALDNFRKSCEICRHLDCEMIQLDSFTPPLKFVGELPYKEAISFGRQFKVKVDPEFNWKVFWSNIVETFKICSGISKEEGLKLCLEPRVGENISNTDAMLRLLDAVDSENFGAVLDVGHLHAQKEILPLSVEKLGSKIFYVHASDNDGRENYHLPPGRGTVDWDALILALNKHGYRGYIAIDIGGSGYYGDIDSDIIESKNFLENLLSRYGLLG